MSYVILTLLLIIPIGLMIYMIYFMFTELIFNTEWKRRQQDIIDIKNEMNRKE
jgi:hypothetical protein